MIRPLLSWFAQKHQERSLSMDQFPDVEARRVQLLSILKKKSTPMFFVDTDILADRYQGLIQALESYWKKHVVAYSFKTNYTIAQTKILQKLGARAEVVSGTEYMMARKLGYEGEQIIFNGPLKRDEELMLAFSEGALVHIDNKEELERAALISERLKRIITLGLRINAHISGIPASRFGFSVERGEAYEVVRRISRNKLLRLVSLHMHIGTDVDDVMCYHFAAQRLAQFAQTIEVVNHVRLRHIDMGGGFPAHGLSPLGTITWDARPIGEYIRSIADGLAAFPLRKKPMLIVEPGRYLVDDAVVFVISAVSIRAYNGMQRVTTDGAVTMLPLRFYRPQIVKAFSPSLYELSDKTTKTIIHGATCREDDVLYQGELPEVSVGDLVVFYCVGAYNQSMGSEFIFGSPPTVFFG